MKGVGSEVYRRMLATDCRLCENTKKNRLLNFTSAGNGFFPVFKICVALVRI
jgi:hypothetical protein